jgi:hypothetical protein
MLRETQRMLCKKYLLLLWSRNGDQEIIAKVGSSTAPPISLIANTYKTGRHSIIVTTSSIEDSKYIVPSSTSTLQETLKGLGRMFRDYPYWDVSYLVAIIFTLGSVVWVFNGFFAWLPLQDPATEFTAEISYGGGITAFVGATIFEFGSILLMIEAVNENRSDCFGWAVEEVLEDNGLLRLRPDKDGCRHHHQNRHNVAGKGNAPAGMLLFHIKAYSLIFSRGFLPRDKRRITHQPYLFLGSNLDMDSHLA